VPRRDWRLYAEDILASVERVDSYTRDLEMEDLAGDSLRMDAVLHNLTIIGEAAAQTPVEVQQRLSEVPWAEMRAMRNFIVHSYHGVRITVIWETIRQDLPLIVPPLRAALDAEDEF
jgi:uncharacterized protein with HEPN domain